jgi:hypothetical protein
MVFFLVMAYDWFIPIAKEPLDETRIYPIVAVPGIGASHRYIRH